MSILTMLAFSPATGWARSNVEPQWPEGIVERAPSNAGAPSTPRSKQPKSRTLIDHSSASLWLQSGHVDWNVMTDHALARSIEEVLQTTPPAFVTVAPMNPSSSVQIDNQRAMFDSYLPRPIEWKSDHKLGRTIAMGATSKYEEAEKQNSPSQTTDQAHEGYFTLRASPQFNIDLRARHGERTTALAGHSAWSAKDAASAKVSGAIDVWQFKFTPTLSVATEAERQALP
jgi:hypothetical protein